MHVNYALFGTPLERMVVWECGRLRKIRVAIDPEEVTYFAGGWKF
jgi:hypothetical protein